MKRRIMIKDKSWLGSENPKAIVFQSSVYLRAPVKLLFPWLSFIIHPCQGHSLALFIHRCLLLFYSSWWRFRPLGSLLLASSSFHHFSFLNPELSFPAWEFHHVSSRILEILKPARARERWKITAVNPEPKRRAGPEGIIKLYAMLLYIILSFMVIILLHAWLLFISFALFKIYILLSRLCIGILLKWFGSLLFLLFINP